MGLWEWLQGGGPYDDPPVKEEDWVRVRFDPQPNITLWELTKIVQGLNNLKWGVNVHRSGLKTLGTAARHFIEVSEKK